MKAEVTRKQMRTSMTFRFIQKPTQPSQTQSMLADMMIVNNEDYISRLSRLSKDTKQRLGTTSLQSTSARRDGHAYATFSKAPYDQNQLRRSEVQTADPAQVKAKKKTKFPSPGLYQKSKRSAGAHYFEHGKDDDLDPNVGMVSGHGLRAAHPYENISSAKATLEASDSAPRHPGADALTRRVATGDREKSIILQKHQTASSKYDTSQPSLQSPDSKFTRPDAMPHLATASGPRRTERSKRLERKTKERAATANAPPASSSTGSISKHKIDDKEEVSEKSQVILQSKLRTSHGGGATSTDKM